MYQKRYFWRGMVASLCMVFSAVQAQEKMWVNSLRAPAAYPQGQARTVMLQAEKSALVQGSITRVQLSLQYAGSAVLKSRLCHQRSGSCIEVVGSSLNSTAFSGLAADSAFLFTYHVWSWAGPTYTLQPQLRLQVQYQ